MKLFFRLSMMIFIISFHAIYSMNQPGEDLPAMISQKTQFRNCIVDVNQRYELHEGNRMTELLRKLLIALAPGGRNLTCFPIINIVQNKNIYYDFITADWVPDFKQIDLFYKNYYALTNFIPTIPSTAISQAIAQLTQFASDMKYENLTISITPTPISFKTKTELEFYALLEAIFPTPAPIVQIVPAPEPQPIAQKHASAGWRNMPVAKTPAQILAPKKLPAKAILTSFKALQRSPAEEARIRTLQAERIAKLLNAAEIPPHSPSADHI